MNQTVSNSNNMSFDPSGKNEGLGRFNLIDSFQMSDLEASSHTIRQIAFHAPFETIDSQRQKQQRKRKSVSSWQTASEYEPTGTKLKLEMNGQTKSHFSDWCANFAPKQQRARELRIATGNIDSNAGRSLNLDANDDAASNNMLHTACQLFSKNFSVVQSALALEPDSIRQRSKRSKTTTESKVTKVTWVREHYSLPINIALRSQASLDVLKLLVDADPSVLIQKDGYSGCASLSIALKCIEQRSHNLCAILNLILSASPVSIRLKDRRMNFPLHIACTIGAPLDVIYYLYANFPEALLQKNFYGETPLSIAERNMRCSDEVVNFLQNCSFAGTMSGA